VHITFTFLRETEAEKTYGADAPAEVIAGGVEEMRQEARIETDRIRGLWEALPALTQRRC
jgi:hypothetical protein